MLNTRFTICAAVTIVQLVQCVLRQGVLKHSQKTIENAHIPSRTKRSTTERPMNCLLILPRSAAMVRAKRKAWYNIGAVLARVVPKTVPFSKAWKQQRWTYQYGTEISGPVTSVQLPVFVPPRKTEKPPASNVIVCSNAQPVYITTKTTLLS